MHLIHKPLKTPIFETTISFDSYKSTAICVSSSHPLRSPLLVQRLPPLRPPLLRLLTQFGRRPRNLLPLHGPHLDILGAIGEEVHPVLDTLLDLRLGIAPLLLLQLLQRAAAVLAVDVRVVLGQVHQLGAAQVGRDVLGEAARHEGARGVDAAEGGVGAARPVEAPAVGDVVNGAVDGEVEREGRV